MYTYKNQTSQQLGMCQCLLPYDLGQSDYLDLGQGNQN